MKKSRFNWSRLSRFMNIFIAVGVWILVMMFIKFNTQVAANTKAAKEAAKDTKLIVSKQDATLQAIKDLATDNKLNSKQLGDTIICMLQVPIAQRTTDVQDQCRKQALGIGSTATPMTPVQNQPTPSSSATPTNTSEPAAPSSPTPPPQQSVVQRAAGAIMRTIRSIL